MNILTILNVCDFCGLEVYLPGALRHPCCDLADRRGESSCQGCETFRKRWERGETCPHAIGKVKACCHPTRGSGA